MEENEIKENQDKNDLQNQNQEFENQSDNENAENTAKENKAKENKAKENKAKENKVKTENYEKDKDLESEELKNGEPKNNEKCKKGGCHCHDDEDEEECNPKVMVARLIVSAVIFAFSFFGFMSELAKIILSVTAFAIIGYDVIWSSVKGIFKGEVFDEKFLMLVASIGAFALKDYHEAVAVMLFYQLGEFLQDLAVDKSKDSIKKLLDIRPDYANIEKNGEIVKVDPKTIKIDDEIVVFAGEKIPVDGIIVDGETTLNTSAITGESLPLDAEVSSTVLSGYINLTGTIKVKATKTFGESTVSKIIEMVENSEDKKAKAENFITKFAKIYTPTVVCLAVVLAIFPPLVLGLEWATWIHRALLFLVVSCPCALVLSIPLSFFAGIGGASRDGILIKGANHIETLSKTNVVCFDKTGTLTNGNFIVTKIFAKDGDEKKLLELCATAEYGSNHPVAKSILEHANIKIEPESIKSQTTLSGFGIKTETETCTIYAGNSKLMKNLNLKFDEAVEIGTAVYVAKDDEYLGYIIVGDEIKNSSKSAIDLLKQSSKQKTVMLTGDKTNVAENIAKLLEVDEFHSELLPDEKAKIVEEYQKQSNIVAFVGDGINDAPVLKIADVGISMGKIGSDVAIESADVVIMDDNPKKVYDAIKKSKKTMTFVKENIVFTIAFKVLMLSLSVFGLTTMWGAVFADVGVSLIAVLNALRALKK